jgi:hypothetical protein
MGQDMFRQQTRNQKTIAYIFALVFTFLTSEPGVLVSPVFY